MLCKLQVKAAMNDINAAQRLRMAAADKAEAAKITVGDKMDPGELQCSRLLSELPLSRHSDCIVVGMQ